MLSSGVSITQASRDHAPSSSSLSVSEAPVIVPCYFSHEAELLSPSDCWEKENDKTVRMYAVWELGRVLSL